VIKTLVQDIYSTVQKKDGWFTDKIRDELSKEVGLVLQTKFNEERGPGRLRISKLGPQCPKALWYSVHHPELAQKPEPWAEIKFSYGHILEALLIALAKASGHTVTGEQDEVSVDGVTGHRDCVIDGCIVDVKSATTFGVKDLKSGNADKIDEWGYLSQLDGYMLGSVDDPLVTVKDKGYILAVDKTLGHLVLYEHKLRADSIRSRIENYKSIIALSEAPPCNCRTEADGDSGNIALSTFASYSAYKYICFPHLRTFLYSGGPRYLTKVVKRPWSPKTRDWILEVDKNGKIVYNYV
jgi:hypothetical protein